MTTAGAGTTQSAILAVIEAPGKVRCLTDILKSAGYRRVEVFATKGHLMSMPSALHPVGFDADLRELLRGPVNRDIVRTLLSKAAGRQEVWVMTDADQEGDAIALDVAELMATLPPDDRPRTVWRIPLASLDKDSVSAALKNRRVVDPGAAVPGRARAIVDRLIGATFSAEGFSAGRVATALLGDVAVRGRDGRGWPLGEAVVVVPAKDGGAPWTARVPIRTPAEAAAWKERTRVALPPIPPRVSESGIPIREPINWAQPWNMGDAMVAASDALGLPTKDTADILQKLYERGRMSYPRTSARRFSAAGAAAVRKMAAAAGAPRFDGKALPIFLGQAGKDETHEALRPLEAVNVSADPKELVKTRPEDAVINLIARNLIRIVSQQMVEKADVSGLPDWAQNLEFQREAQPRMPWRDPQAEAGVKLRAQDAAVLGCMLESGLGRPSTLPNHVSKFCSRGLVGPDLQVTSKGMEWISKSPPALLRADWARDVEQILDTLHRAALGRDADGIPGQIPDEIQALIGDIDPEDLLPSGAGEIEPESASEQARALARAMLDRLPQVVLDQVAKLLVEQKGEGDLSQSRDKVMTGG